MSPSSDFSRINIFPDVCGRSRTQEEVVMTYDQIIDANPISCGNMTKNLTRKGRCCCYSMKCKYCTEFEYILMCRVVYITGYSWYKQNIFIEHE